ncbi:MAG: hypothetical protein QXL94_08205 [Candidatus Parvarchaeum sp.]
MENETSSVEIVCDRCGRIIDVSNVHSVIGGKHYCFDCSLQMYANILGGAL